MTRKWEFDTDQMIHVSGDDWLEYGSFGADTYGLHTKLDGRDAIIRIDAENSKDATDEADNLLDKLADGWRATNWECSITEAAQMLGVSRQRVHVMLQAGQLDGRKVGNTWCVDRESVARRMSRNLNV